MIDCFGYDVKNFFKVFFAVTVDFMDILVVRQFGGDHGILPCVRESGKVCNSESISVGARKSQIVLMTKMIGVYYKNWLP
jgi:hypothetical protein